MKKTYIIPAISPENVDMTDALLNVASPVMSSDPADPDKESLSRRSGRFDTWEDDEEDW